MSNEAQAPEQKQATGSSWSLKVATVAGIPVRVHFTFLFLLAYAAYVGQRNSGGWLLWVAFFLALFFCVVLHEFGHALTAKKFGIKTRDITLYPIGGVAMFEGRMKPNQELWIALAGPLVNVVICILLAIYLVVFEGGIPFLGADMLGHGIPAALFFANAILAIFNLIPAFPMDGGRVLRAFLGLYLPENKATAIAGTVGQAMAVLLGLFAFFTLNPLLILIAVFVFMGAGQEMAATNTRTFLEGHLVREAMQVRFRTVQHGDTMQTAADMLLAGSQHDFPVLAGDEIAGVLTRTDIARGLATDGPTGYVAGFMQREIKSTSPEAPLDEAIELFAGDNSVPILVREQGHLVGMLTAENVSEFIMLQHALMQSGYRRPA